MHLISTKTGNLRNVNMYFAPFILHTSSNYKSVILSVPKFTANMYCILYKFAVYLSRCCTVCGICLDTQYSPTTSFNSVRTAKFGQNLD